MLLEKYHQKAKDTEDEYLKSEYQKLIDKLEKSKIKVKEYRKKNDEYLWWGIISILLLTLFCNSLNFFFNSLKSS